MSSLEPLGKRWYAVCAAVLLQNIMALINLCYDIFPPKKTRIPIISVGGISAGGSGKTPVVDLVIQLLIRSGKTPILLSRGYGRHTKKTMIIPPDDACCWQDVGDEPMLLRRRHPKLWLLIDANRRRALRLLGDTLPENAVGIMDDGFQHRALHRDLDIVVLPENIQDENMMPVGRLREPMSSLKRANIILTSEIEPMMSNAFRILFMADTFVHTITGERKKYFESSVSVFCGIARPFRFVESVKKRVKSIRRTVLFPDHHSYESTDYQEINGTVKEILVTTEKDLMRIDVNNLENRNYLWYLSLETSFLDSEDEESFKRQIYQLCGVV